MLGLTGQSTQHNIHTTTTLSHIFMGWERHQRKVNLGIRKWSTQAYDVLSFKVLSKYYSKTSSLTTTGENSIQCCFPWQILIQHLFQYNNIQFYPFFFCPDVSWYILTRRVIERETCKYLIQWGNFSPQLDFLLLLLRQSREYCVDSGRWIPPILLNAKAMFSVFEKP